jgi:hypothetical protein
MLYTLWKTSTAGSLAKPVSTLIVPPGCRCYGSCNVFFCCPEYIIRC